VLDRNTLPNIKQCIDARNKGAHMKYRRKASKMFNATGAITGDG
jgi:hypothetical protein